MEGKRSAVMEKEEKKGEEKGESGGWGLEMGGSEGREGKGRGGSGAGNRLNRHSLQRCNLQGPSGTERGRQWISGLHMQFLIVSNSRSCRRPLLSLEAHQTDISFISYFSPDPGPRIRRSFTRCVMGSLTARRHCLVHATTTVHTQSRVSTSWTPLLYLCAAEAFCLLLSPFKPTIFPCSSPAKKCHPYFFILQ